MKVLVIYHGRCADGTCAAWCADLYFRGMEDVEVEYYPAKHNKPPPYKRIEKSDRTYILDFCYPREELLKMSSLATVRVLDHHKSAEATCHGLPFCTFDMDRSGAGMAWDNFFPGVDRPWIVDYVETRDIWVWKWPNAKDVLAFVDTLPITFETFDKLHDGDITFGECRDKGAAITAYIEQYNSETVLASMRQITFQAPDGSIHFDIPVVNTSHWGISSLLNGIADGHTFVLAYFKRNDGKYQYSGRVSANSDFDVSKLAKSFGGGGHAKASGFTLDHEIEELPPKGAGKLLERRVT
jgi:oligoribonuclease NrnB/cAMP/cGMP phosphodiesterase (DHH superfamily)